MQLVETPREADVWTPAEAPGYNGPMAEKWLSTKQAAKLAGYHPEHVRELAREGRIEARKFGPLWQIDRESILAYVAEQEAKGDRRGPKPD